MILITSQKLHCDHFLLYSLLNIRKHSYEISRLDLFKKGMKKIYNSQILEIEKHQRNPSKGSYHCVDISGFVGSSRREKQKRKFFSHN